jgi:hypothetical protein
MAFTGCGYALFSLRHVPVSFILAIIHKKFFQPLKSCFLRWILWKYLKNISALNFLSLPYAILAIVFIDIMTMVVLPFFVLFYSLSYIFFFFLYNLVFYVSVRSNWSYKITWESWKKYELYYYIVSICDLVNIFYKTWWYLNFKIDWDEFHLSDKALLPNSAVVS